MTDSGAIAKIKARCKVGERGCWVWQGFCQKPPRAYGETNYLGKKWRVHRLMYTLVYGPIPDGKLVCHKCDNPSCCNPDHLWLGTHLENMSDCRAKDRYHYANLTHCKRGHEFTPENTEWRGPGHLRQCRTCARARLRIKAGWPEDLAYSMPAVRKGKRPLKKSWAAARIGRKLNDQTV
jgi:hypothetical protein